MLYNGSIHASLGVTPNSLKFGHEVPGPGEILLGRPPPLAQRTAPREPSPTGSGGKCR